MAPKLYIYHGSPPCRAVMITAKAVGINLDIHVINAEKDEIHSPEFLKLNPQHTVPTFVDGENVLCDSHAINTYLIAKYGKIDSLYPKDLYRKALVDEKLYFDAGVLFPHLRAILALFIGKEITLVSAAQAKPVKESYAVLEKFLEMRQWVTGDNVTLADFSLVTTITCLDVLVPVKEKEFPNVTAWIKRAQALSWLSGDEEEIKMFIMWYKTLLP